MILIAVVQYLRLTLVVYLLCTFNVKLNYDKRMDILRSAQVPKEAFILCFRKLRLCLCYPNMKLTITDSIVA
jgi:hypothetical protein